MIRINITTEGQTEQAFVKRILSSHLASYDIYANSRCVLTSKDRRINREFRGGLNNYNKVRKDIITWMKEDSSCHFFSTMFDYYALPDDFPGYAESQRLSNPYDQIDCLESAFKDDIKNKTFIPYIQLYEFETMIFADPSKLNYEYMNHDSAITHLLELTNSITNPELINNGKQTAPSKRIKNEIPEYDKVGAGVNIVQEIGLDTIRQKCHHFDNWLNQLESLS